MKIKTLLFLSALGIAPAFADTNSVAVNYQQGTGKTITGAYDGATTWANPDANSGTGSANATTFQGVSTWFQAGDYWSGTTNPSADVIYRSDFSVGTAINSTLTANTGGITGSWAGMIAVSGLSQWMTANNYSGYTITLYYASRNAVVISDLGHVYSGVTYSDASTLSGKTADYQFSTPAGGWTSGSNYYGKSISSTLTADNLLIAFGLTSGSIQGGVAGMKIDGISAVPEPSAYGLLGAGALVAVTFVRRRRRAA